MSFGKGFCDLNIKFTDDPSLKQTVLKALSLGYQTVAITKYVLVPDANKPSGDDKEGGSKKRKKDQGGNGFKNLVPPPATVNITKSDLQKHKITREPVILSRITIDYSDPSSPFLSLYANSIKQYDLVAFVPRNDATLMQIVKSKLVDVDIISLPLAASTYHLSRHLLKSAVERDIYFEICYSPCLVDPHSRKETLILSHFLHRTNKSANIIITSRASWPQDLRYPYDVMNVGRFFGLSEFVAISSIGKTAHNAIYCARARRKGISKCVVQITVLDENPQTAKFEGLEDPSTYLRNVNGVDGPARKKHKKPENKNPEKNVTLLGKLLRDVFEEKKESEKKDGVSTGAKKSKTKSKKKGIVSTKANKNHTATKKSKMK